MLLLLNSFIFVACDNNKNKKITKEMVDEQNNRITEEEIEEIENRFKGYDSVLDCSVKVKDKTVYIMVKFNESISLKKQS